MKSRSAQAARSARRRFKWERRNRPQFGPLNEWEVDPKPVVVDRRRLMYTPLG